VNGAYDIIDENSKDFTELFYDILGHFASERNLIAKRAKTPGYRFFGVSRFQEWGRTDKLFTPHSFKYKDFGEQFLKDVPNYLKEIDYPTEKSTKTEKTFAFDQSLGRKSQVRVELLHGSYEGDLKYGSQFELSEIIDACKIFDKTINRSFSAFDQFHKSVTWAMETGQVEALIRLKEEFPDLYHASKTVILMRQFDEEFSDYFEHEYAIITHRVEVEGKMVDLSTFITRFNSNEKNEPAGYINKKPCVLLEHQDPLLNTETLREISQIFKEIMELDPNEKALIDQKKKLMQYFLSHCTPFIRGSAAVTEWFGEAVVRTDKASFLARKPNLINLESLTIPYHLFAKKISD
ncbi:MAG: hypothetical protein AAGG81_03555, partial [Chlamydiota bacterium]